jgi:thiamine-monophosphate kinase
MNISRLGEFGLIDRIKSGFTVKTKGLVGIGDDAAVIPFAGKDLLITTDTMVENVHFDRKYTKMREVGWKIAAVNISDIAAMGGYAKYALVTLGLKDSFKVKDVDEIYKGISQAFKTYGIKLIGGDIVRSPKDLFITMDMVGECKRPVLRSGAKPGDVIATVGILGASAAGLKALKKYGRKKPGNNTRAHLLPMPMLEQGQKLSGFATSMIDNSDGLARCIIEICKESRVGAIISLGSLPLAKGATIDDALNGGEDYNLIFTARKKDMKDVKGVTVIGEITSQKNIIAVDKNGKKMKVRIKGFEHF